MMYSQSTNIITNQIPTPNTDTMQTCSLTLIPTSIYITENMAFWQELDMEFVRKNRSSPQLVSESELRVHSVNIAAQY